LPGYAKYINLEKEMTAHDFLLIFFGIGIGWITKIPFMLKWHREMIRERDSIRLMVTTHLAIINRSKNKKTEV